MGKALAHVDMEMSRIRAGKASPAMLDGLRVDYYGTPTPMSQVATISAPDARRCYIKALGEKYGGRDCKSHQEQ